ncbi:MAG: zinc transporter ZntB [Planctomycetes bacterium]|nr:zinc transporter ZntB [Planctomycetota bacterium]
MSNSNAEVFRVGLDGNGGLAAAADSAKARWTHYRLEEDSAEWLAAQRRLAEDIAEALVIGNARPRATILGGGLLVVLRGVNHNPGAEPEDMVSMRAWVEADRIVTVSPRRVMAVEDVRAQLQAGDGPVSAGEILAAITGRLVERMRPIVDGLGDTVDQLHEQLLDRGPNGLQRELSELRHVIVQLRRHMAPQRDAIEQLQRVSENLLAGPVRAELHHIADRQIRYVEDLDSVRERATVLQDEIDNSVQSRLNHNIYVLSVVAAVFLPLGLLTGLLGINVGGMPGIESPYAFWIVVALLLAIAVGEILFLRRRRML